MANKTQSFQAQIARADLLIEALPYLQTFRGQTMVIKYGGAAMEDPNLVGRVLRDVVFLEAVGINPVIVHGGGKAINARLAESGVQARFIGGLRVTDAATMQIVDQVLNQAINPGIVARINSLGGRARSFDGKRVFQAVKAAPVHTPEGPADLGFVGEVSDCVVDEVLAAVAHEVVPVISPLGSDHTGRPLNINADLAAAALASRIQARRILFLSDVNGILRVPSDPATRIPTVSRVDVARLTEEGILGGGMLPKVRSCLEALEAGVEKVHLIDGRIPHALLLELFTDTGIGTEIVLESKTQPQAGSTMDQES